jgi:hypothetical protein
MYVPGHVWHSFACIYYVCLVLLCMVCMDAMLICYAYVEFFFSIEVYLSTLVVVLTKLFSPGWL